MPTVTESSEKPRPEQMRDLRRAADACGETFTWPKTSAEADAQLEHLRSRFQCNVVEPALDRLAVARAMAERGGAARVRDSEIEGYGSSAHWKVGR